MAKIVFVRTSGEWIERWPRVWWLVSPKNRLLAVVSHSAIIERGFMAEARDGFDSAPSEQPSMFRPLIVIERCGFDSADSAMDWIEARRDEVLACVRETF